MSDTSLEVRYMKRRQENQFEPAEAEVKAVFSVADTVDLPAMMDDALARCKASVLKVLGLGKLVPAAGANAADIAVTGAQPEKPVAEKRGPGRPSNKELAQKAATKALETADPMVEVTQAIQTGEERTDPEADDVMDLGVVETPKDEAVETKITDNELQTEAAKAVQRLGTPDPVRKMVKQNYRVARLDEVEQRLRSALVSDLRNLQKDGTIKVAEKK